MEGYRFYEEFLDKSKKRSAGNAVAVMPENSRLERIHGQYVDIIYEAVGSVFSSPNSPVASTGVSRDYLRTNTKRVGEARARRVHPELFKYLEQS
jgi:hypothetical protein